MRSNPAVFQVAHPRGDIEQEPLVHHVGVVVEVAAVVPEDGVAPGREPRHDIMARELAPRMHQVDRGARLAVGRPVEDAEAVRGVSRLEVDDVAAYRRIEVGEGERQSPDALFEDLGHGYPSHPGCGATIRPGRNYFVLAWMCSAMALRAFNASGSLFDSR